MGVGLVAVVFVGWPDILAFVNRARPGNVAALYTFRGAMKPGMSRDALQEVVAATKAPVRTLWKSPEELLVWVPVGFMESAYLQVFVAGDAVVHARIRGDSGEIIPGAPADF
jgi:hypothetical protein